MSLEKKRRTCFVCAALDLGVLGGIAVPPDEIRALMNQINQPKLAHVLPADQESGGDTPIALNEDGAEV